MDVLVASSDLMASRGNNATMPNRGLQCRAAPAKWKALQYVCPICNKQGIVKCKAEGKKDEKCEARNCTTYI